jgi:hypothetical protein
MEVRQPMKSKEIFTHLFHYKLIATTILFVVNMMLYSFPTGSISGVLPPIDRSELRVERCIADKRAELLSSRLHLPSNRSYDNSYRTALNSSCGIVDNGSCKTFRDVPCNESCETSRGESRSTGNALWEFQGIENVECVTPLSDQNGDGFPEAVIMTYDAGATGDFLYCIKGNSEGTGDVLWSSHPYGGVSGGGGYGDQCLDTLDDITGDDLQDILLGTAWGGRSGFGIDGNAGTDVWIYDTYEHEPSGWINSVSPIDDVNGDGIHDALLGAGAYHHTLLCIEGDSRGDATVLWSYYNSLDGFTTVTSIPDVSGDGIADAVAGVGGNFNDDRVFCVSGASTGPDPDFIWIYDTNAGCVEDISPIEDVNGSGFCDVLVGDWDGIVTCLEGESGDPLWQYNPGDLSVVMRVEACPDVNDDGTQDVLVGSWKNAIICVDGKSGVELWSTPTGSLNGGDVWSIYPVGDIDGDEVGDVAAGSFDYNVYCCSGTDGTVRWQYYTGNRLLTVRGIGDVNGDGVPDVIAGTQMLSSVGGKAYAIEGDSHGPWIDAFLESSSSHVSPGETLRLTVTLENTTAKGKTFDAWLTVKKAPFPKEMDIAHEQNAYLPQGKRVRVPYRLKVPKVTPPALYTLTIYVGKKGEFVWDSSEVEVEVTGP